MKILVINAGSSSLKYQLIEMDGEQVIAKGNCERIGIDGRITQKSADGREYKAEINMPDHTVAFACVVKALTESAAKVIDDMGEISAVGHRVVQGGDIFSESVLITPEVIEKIESLNPLAPLHNPAGVQGLRACTEVLGANVPQVGVFDTAFHATMPPKAYMYAIPYEYYEKYHIRRYGFHGTSHRYVSARCYELLGRQPEGVKLITCHLGNGSSITAIKDGKVIDTSMGFTPLDGFMMGTRSGSLDPSVVTYIAEKEGLTPDEMSDLLNKKSGTLGISGVSSDERDIDAAIASGNERAKLGRSMMRYQITKFVGGYVAAMNGVDALVFTGGIGENTPALRDEVISALSFMGAKVDSAKNAAAIHGAEGEISTADSTVRCFVIPTNEELVIARDTKRIVESL